MAKPSTVGINFRILGGAILHRWPIVLLPTIVLPLALLVFGPWLPKRYKVSAQLLVQESIAVNPFLEDMGVPWTVRERLPVIQAILLSRATLEKALRYLGEIEDRTPPKVIDHKVAGLRSQISVYGMGGGLINIDVVGESPERLHKGLVYMVDALIETMLQPQKQSVDDASRFLDKQIKETRTSVTSLEAKIEKFKKEHADELPEVFAVNLNAYKEAQGSLLARQTELHAARTKKKSLEQRLKNYDPIARELDAKLIKAKTRLSELKAVYTDEHPEIVALKSHIEQLKREQAKLKSSQPSEPGRIDLDALEGVAQLKSGGGTSSGRSGSGGGGKSDDLLTSDLMEYKDLTAEIAALQGTVSELNKHGEATMDSVKSYATTERVFQGLMRDYEVKQKTYKMLLEKSEEAKITRALSMFDEDEQVVLIEAPRLPTSQVGLTSRLNLIVAFVVGLGLGLSVVILGEFFGGTVRSLEEVEAVTGLKVIGTLPYLFAPPRAKT
jgi:polysaccharide chain length determinant protein (PEP-CTERM system associated)